ncbi:MAG: sulfatase-like hydrolase/transferase [Fimbriimonadaceae bacterium]|nr:sulfatase-like hydrolase/transferase [Chitinophagales bacterium]
MKTPILFITLIFLIFLSDHLQAQEPKPNIIFIIVDDLNDYTADLGGHPQSETPGMTAIANLGTQFTNTHCPAPKCAPSRTSFMSGKDCDYTQIYNNPACNPFREYFDGKPVFTLPEYLKDSANYFTVGINKIYHCFDSEPDYDMTTSDACSKSLSWNKYIWFYNGESFTVSTYANTHKEGLPGIQWSRIPDSLEEYMYDHIAIDSAIEIINMYDEGDDFACGKPLFINIGLRRPHTPFYIPESYYSSFYLEDIYASAYELPYNHPKNEFPYNGIVMPEQPEPKWADYYALPLDGIAQTAATYDEFELQIDEYSSELPFLPVINDTLTDAERIEIIEESKRANAVMGYLAATKFVDAQIGRLYDALQDHPEFLSNTIIVIAGDNGFSHGQKKHWLKGTMWETDLRVPFIIADMRNPIKKVCKSSVSLLDIFPTICDLIDETPPVISDGSTYLDGISLVPFMNNPNVQIEKPSLASYDINVAGGYGCYPMYSVRSDEFHFISYKGNTTSICGNDETVFYEEELYEIGASRERDANEWNNLINDPDYNIVKQYLQQWLPDSSLYLQATYSIKIKDKACYHNTTDNVSLSASLFNKNGTNTTIPAGKHLVWWTNLSTDSSLSATFNFSLSSIPEITSGAENEMLIYAALYDETYQTIEGLSIKRITIQNTPSLFPSYTVKTKKKRAIISGVSYPAGTTSATWDYGDGYIYSGLTPPLHIYAGYGTYTVVCTATTGGCTVAKRVTILLDAGTHIYTKLSPNPVKDYVSVNIQATQGNYDIEIFNSAGLKVLEQNIQSETGNENVEFNTQQLPAGSYIVKITGEGWMETQKFMKVD